MDSLVSTAWLAEELGADDLLVLDASLHLPTASRNAAEEFQAGHIPGARLFDLGALVDETSAVPSAHPRPEQLAGALAKCGISANTRIVIYDDSALRTSARAWFLLRAHGIENAGILDGGLGKWKAERRALENGTPRISAAAPMPLTAPSRMRYKADMLANIKSATEQVLDARDNGRFTGSAVDTVHNLPSGHIPGSSNLPFGALFAEDGTYKSLAALETAFAEAGITADRPITTTCGSGITASVLLFALHLIGREDTALYDGSWSDWGSDPDTPKASV